MKFEQCYHMSSSPCKTDDTSEDYSNESEQSAEYNMEEEAFQGLENLKNGAQVFTVCRAASAEHETEERYSRKDKSLSQLSKRFLSEFGMVSNQLISMFEVTDRLSKFKL